jgi:hypothetical protein
LNIFLLFIFPIIYYFEYFFIIYIFLFNEKCGTRKGTMVRLTKLKINFATNRIGDCLNPEMKEKMERFGEIKFLEFLYENYLLKDILPDYMVLNADFLIEKKRFRRINFS